MISTVRDTENFAFWHSATFNNDATKVVFTDELGGGGLATCTGEYAPPELGANGIYDIEKDRKKGGKDGTKLVFQSYYKIPRINDATENCVAHNGSLIPPSRARTSWSSPGTRAASRCSTSPTRRTRRSSPGSTAARASPTGGTWSTYWYNGYAYSNDLAIGFDTFDIDDRIDGKAKTNLRSLNPQMQEKSESLSPASPAGSDDVGRSTLRGGPADVALGGRPR